MCRHSAALTQAMKGQFRSKGFRMGSRLDDVAWDLGEACKLATADSGPSITLLDFGKVGEGLKGVDAFTLSMDKVWTLCLQWMCEWALLRCAIV